MKKLIMLLLVMLPILGFSQTDSLKIKGLWIVNDKNTLTFRKTEISIPSVYVLKSENLPEIVISAEDNWEDEPEEYKVYLPDETLIGYLYETDNGVFEFEAYE